MTVIPARSTGSRRRAPVTNKSRSLMLVQMLQVLTPDQRTRFTAARPLAAGQRAVARTSPRTRRAPLINRYRDESKTMSGFDTHHCARAVMATSQRPADTAWAQTQPCIYGHERAIRGLPTSASPT